ncbi:hypothetical protein D3C78_1659420 [compost metagenome]
MRPGTASQWNAQRRGELSVGVAPARAFGPGDGEAVAGIGQAAAVAELPVARAALTVPVAGFAQTGVHRAALSQRLVDVHVYPAFLPAGRLLVQVGKVINVLAEGSIARG